MADAAVVRTLVDNGREIIVHLMCVSDGTGETGVVKIDKSAIAQAADGAEADSLDLAWIRWAVQGFSSVRLLHDHTTDDLLFICSGNGYEDFIGAQGEREAGVVATANDPRSAGATGDVLLTSVGAAANATYDITVAFRKATS